jgi:hypothetical protein
MVKTFIIAAALVGSAMAACPNGCSGNGICGANDKCSCYQNWQGPDCSLRTCTYSLAWADTADGTNQAHYYAECSNKGVCDRKTGECKCFDGYEGKGCRRSTCPDGCSGHGTCEYIDELAVDYEDRRTGPGASKQSSTWVPLSNAVTQSDNSQVNNGFLYQLWDAQKIQGCKCDLGYSGPDCAGRVAPKGDDPLTTVKSVTQVQMVQIISQSDTTTGVAILANAASTTVAWAGTASLTVASSPNTFFVVYHDQYGGVWRTDSIEISTTQATTAMNAQNALRQLPNEVLEGVTVTARTGGATTCLRATDGAQHIPSAEGHGTSNVCTQQSTSGATDASQPPGTGASHTAATPAASTTVDFDVTFADKPGQTGVQFLLEVDISYQGDGAFPTSRGVLAAASTAVVAEKYVAEVANKDTLSELAECSDRGLDNGDGECECFDGFRGLACEEQEALV